MKKYKLLASDLDGTLLNSDVKISQKNIDAIKKCIDNDIHVVISSGRSPQSIDQFLQILNLKGENIYGSGFHGGRIFSADKLLTISDVVLDKKLCLEILSKLQVSEKVGILVYKGDELYSTNINKHVDMYCQRCQVPVVLLQDYTSIDGDISKILVRGESDTLSKIKEEFSCFEDRCKVVYSGKDLLEFISYESNKGKSLLHICQLLNIDIEDTVGIGDNYNDIELVETAGFGVAVANAVEPLKQIADYVTIATNNEDALSEVVEKFFFN